MWFWLRRHIFQNVGTKLIALALAIMLYVYVFASRDREIVLDVPLLVQGVPQSLLWSGEIPDVARVRFRGVGVELLKLGIRRPGARILLEVGEALPGQYRRSLVTKDVVVPSDVEVQVVEVVAPREIAVDFDQVLVRRLAAVASVTGRPAPGYIRYGPLVVEPDTVVVRGPEKHLQSFEFLKSDPVDISGRDETVIQECALHVPPRCEALPQVVMVRVELEKVISRTFAGLSVDVLRSDDVTLMSMAPEVGSVVVTGPEAVVESLATEELRLSIDALGLPPGTYTLMASVELVRSQKSGAVSVEPVEPEKFEVELE
ncbi:YbbR-like domain-containing protein [Candidatus Eisenbacteria bacterium]|uniref:YbbR-like domain-containing protein n=1 Tax=Eiseniibacteriota bacterium TaxID=2212470 RepID=A0ABV6YKQ4_UNCEI